LDFLMHSLLASQWLWSARSVLSTLVLFFRLTREEKQLLLSCFSDWCSAVSS
jgi:hypothetical protein